MQAQDKQNQDTAGMTSGGDAVAAQGGAVMAVKKLRRPKGSTPEVNHVLDVFERWGNLPDEHPEKAALREELRHWPQVEEILSEHEREEALAAKLLGRVFRYEALPPFVFWIDRESAMPGWVWANTTTRAAVRLPVSEERHGQIWGLLAGEAARDQDVWDRLLALIGDGVTGEFEIFTDCAPSIAEAEVRP